MSRASVFAPALLSVMVLVAAMPAPVAARTVGQAIDDTAITTEVKAKLAADKLSSLTKIGVKTENGVVTLTGTVDTPERRAAATAIALSVKNVAQVVNDLVVSGPAPAPPPAAPAVSSGPLFDATGTVARVDTASGTVTLQDGRVLRLMPGSIVWQPTTAQALTPGAPVLVRGAAPAGYAPQATSTAPEWRMGTVARVNAAANGLVLTDGTTVRLTPSAQVHRGTRRVDLAQVEPGSEVVARAPAAAVAGADGSALARPTASAPVFDASDVDIVWAPR